MKLRGKKRRGKTPLVAGGRGTRMLAAALLWALALAWPAQAVAPGVPARVVVRLVSDIDPVLSAVEAELIKQAVAPPPTVSGITLRLKNYLEDVVVLAGKRAEIHPPAIVSLVATELKKGTDKRVIALKLVELQRQGKL